jgi:hypothetical protein
MSACRLGPSVTSSSSPGGVFSPRAEFSEEVDDFYEKHTQMAVPSDDTAIPEDLKDVIRRG